MMIALILTSVSSLLISVRDPSGVYYLIAYGIVGVGISITLAIAQAGIIAESSAGRFGRSAGVFESSIGIGACAGPIIGGDIRVIPCGSFHRAAHRFCRISRIPSIADAQITD